LSESSKTPERDSDGAGSSAEAETEHEPFSVSAVMFAFNEAANVAEAVAATLRVLEAHTDDHEVVLVDDGSTDGTPAIVADLREREPRLQAVRHPVNRGIGEAVHTGYAYASKDFVCILPADGQVRMSEYVGLFEAARAGADMVLARYQQRNQVDGLHRLILSGGLRLMMRALLGVDRQIDAAFLFRRALLDELPLTSRSFFVNLELPIRVIRAGYRVEEAPMRVFPRASGRSKVVRARQVASVALDLLALRLRLWREAAFP
jgi:glycosyltransferase involved in cell wall biosynthesis